MRLWRLASPRFAEAPDGEGARQFGGRWNSAGIPVIYSSVNVSTALLEMLVHVDPDYFPDDYRLVELYAPDDVSATTIELKEFPAEWRDDLDQAWFKMTGDEWLEGQSTLLMLVPSVIVPSESNALINPRHADHSHVEVRSVTPFPIDRRFKV